MSNAFRHIRHWIFLAFACWIVVAVATAQAEDLKTVYELALARDARYQAAQAQYLASRETTPQARSFLLPQL
ncbi:MAG TPA: hypothetical protein ENK62_04700, partial [Chromatiales bacterium]|nr:hypothetical protein [Chromatiales bacterium]